MKLQAMCVLDSATGAYLPPQFFRTIGEGERSFIDACNREDTQFNRHSKDYAFCHVGVFDDSTGEYTQVQGNPVVLTATNAKALQQKQYELEKEIDGKVPKEAI